MKLVSDQNQVQGKAKQRSRKTNRKQDSEDMSMSREQGNSRRAVGASGAGGDPQSIRVMFRCSINRNSPREAQRPIPRRASEQPSHLVGIYCKTV